MYTNSKPFYVVFQNDFSLYFQLIITADPNRVRVGPATDLGLFWAFVRAALKSMAVAFLFPVCVMFLFLPCNRAM